ncbi:MAG TPA: LLM class flavin-dependent oxidoreductase [Oceanobacillus sp.]|nr:LLM class flavin-dependent oxidoreductase [Oceanobacillus sp.]
MPIEWGWGITEGNQAGQPPKRWLDDMDAAMPHLKSRFTSIWMTDHFFWGSDPTHEAWTVISYLAARYPEMTVGPIVLGQSYRNPALLAKMGATLQVLSGGRFIMGIGAGWKEDEYHAYNYEYPSARVRLEQLEDTLEILTRMWTEPGKVTYQGKHYRITEAYCEPKPDPVPPILVGGGGDTTIKLAAKYAQFWNLSDAPIERYTERVNVLKQHCERIGRDPATIRLSWYGRIAVGRDESEAERRGFGKWTRENAFVGTPSQIVEQMSAFVAVGCDHFIVQPLGLPDPYVIGALMNEIVPNVKA